MVYTNHEDLAREFKFRINKTEENAGKISTLYVYSVGFGHRYQKIM
jgi:hypothetical protein